MEDPVPEKAVDFINKLVEVWLRSNIEEKNELARNSLAFIDEQLALISKIWMKWKANMNVSAQKKESQM